MARTDWLLVGLLFVAGLFAAAQFGKVALALAAWEGAYPARAAQVPLLVSAVGVVGIVLGVVAGPQVVRFGVRRSLIAALLLGGLASLAQAAALPFGLLVGTRLAEGLSHLVIVVAAPTLMAAVATDRDRPVVMGLWGMFFGVSFALLAAVLPGLLAAGGLALVCAAQGAGMLALAAGIVPRLPGRPVAAPPPPESFAAAHRAAYGTARRIAPAAGFFWHTLVFVALLTFLPPQLPAGAGTILPLAGLAGTFAAGWLSRHVPPYRIAQVSFVATMPLILGLWALPGAWQLALAVALFVSLGLVPGASFAAVPWLNHEAGDQARAYGAIAQLGNVGTSCGTPLLALAMPLGAASATTGFTLACSVAGLGTLALVLRRLDLSQP